MRIICKMISIIVVLSGQVPYYISFLMLNLQTAILNELLQWLVVCFTYFVVWLTSLVYCVSRQRSNCGFGSVADNLVFHLELRSSTVARNAKIYLTRYLKTKAILMELTLEQHSLICYL
ncbi:hypothetical protein IGI04_015209 [Brassica rapa subsp. trilocularis]|uniref:Uncharacterized protein n=1 Tax=Brassica rapa subsp. trilocularis TaxID=1813537 RepID=A0ABQ7MPH8_BRACM|nr:hypothetical protein IGI04_015209 [Brassica rapa subsp. trilocularis]